MIQRRNRKMIGTSNMFLVLESNFKEGSGIYKVSCTAGDIGKYTTMRSLDDSQLTFCKIADNIIMVVTS